MYAHALVIGKFYPPHAGHHALIRHAAGVAGRVTVVAMAASVESIPIDNRVSWLAQAHRHDTTVTVTGVVCDAPIDMGSQPVWAAQVAAMRAGIAQVTTDPVDVVVSSESYGGQLAQWFDAAHVTFDPERTAWPVSGRACRADLVGHWPLLEPGTRAGLTTRVVVLGSESTGTTTVSSALAQHYRERGGVWAQTRWVPEHGRQVTIDKLTRAQAVNADATMHDLTWEGPDFAQIAHAQQVAEDTAAAEGSPLLVCDTDAFATTVWERRYLGPASRWARDRLVASPSVYLVTDHVGVRFVQDGIRDGEHIRAAMTGWFTDALTRSARPWVLLTGSVQERLELAIRVTDMALDRRATFADPLEMR
ncbi:AAA family ATPase [Williamsia sp. CHRR-6]|uniref:AAA family ATPase n=1 Tax=Williamsia sp. CHRR-6 TaxID=2835871 RepID=UPI001BDB084D|nr:AAA family ATPase [Williamsia sp. CHRR-6]MBT0566480.1 AAA family ATPase [Williamsia sp. CHRR-6]